VRLYLVRTDRGVQAADEATREAMRSWPVGEVVACDSKRSRNIKHHRKAFALIELLFENQDRFNTVTDLLVELKIKLGWYNEHITQAGEVVYVPRSIAFDSMSQDDFEANFYQPLTDLALREYLPQNLPRHQLEDELMRRLQF
jgi:hypothetical protein